VTEKITIIGTGNVAHHLGKRFKEKGFTINQIVGRNAEKAAQLAAILGADFSIKLKKIKKDSAVYIIAVSDDAIVDVAKKIAKNIDNQLVVHTSGSVPSSVLQPYIKHFGSFYPLQTFSINSQPNFDDIPIFYNATPTLDAIRTPPQYFQDFLEKIALSISKKAYLLPDDKRIILHIAAVFVNNFTNYLYTIGEDILKNEQLPFDVLKPLIAETVRKIENNPPKDMQTGPAKRGDIATIEKHLDYLNNHTPQYLELYTLLTNQILKNK
jgi:predicted short-subunit dehydrogenase-like oxidoreductase (DUF2520 family)